MRTMHADALFFFFCRQQPANRPGGRGRHASPANSAGKRKSLAGTECWALAESSHSICGQQFLGPYPQGTPSHQVGKSEFAESKWACRTVSTPNLYVPRRSSCPRIRGRLPCPAASLCLVLFCVGSRRARGAPLEMEIKSLYAVILTIGF